MAGGARIYGSMRPSIFEGLGNFHTALGRERDRGRAGG